MASNSTFELEDLKDWKAVGAVLFIIMMPVAAIGLQSAGLRVFQITGSSTCLDAAQEVKWDSSAYNFEGNDAWSIEFTPGCNQKIAGGGGTISKEEIKSSKDGHAVRAERDFSMGLTNFKAWYFKTIDKQNPSNTYSFEAKKFKCDGSWGSTLVGGCTESDKQEVQDWINNGADGFGNYDFKDPGWLGSDYYVAYRAKRDTGDIYEFDYDDGSAFKGEVTLCSGGRCDTGTITKDSPTAVVEQGGHRAEIEWRGSRIGTLRDIDFSAVQPVYIRSKGKTVVTAKEFVNDYMNSRVNLQSCIESKSLDNFDQCINEINTDVQNVNTDRSQVITNNLGTIDATLKVTANEARVIAEDSQAIEQPVFHATMDEGWIGIVELLPEPQIGSLRNFKMKNQGQVTVQIPVSNGGKKGGDINVDVQCDGPFQAGSDRGRVEAGTSRVFEVQISASTGVPDVYTCNVEARAAGGSGDKAVDTGQFSVTLVKKQKACSDCFGTGDGSSDGGKGTVVHPPDKTTQLDWPMIVAALAFILLLIGVGWWLYQR